jgi:hypothetical protein
MMEALYPWGLFIVIALIVSRLLWPILSGPVGAIIGFLVAIFGLRPT